MSASDLNLQLVLSIKDLATKVLEKFADEVTDLIGDSKKLEKALQSSVDEATHLDDATDSADKFAAALEDVSKASQNSAYELNATVEVAQKLNELSDNLLNFSKDAAGNYLELSGAIDEVSTLVDTTINSTDQLEASAQKLASQYGENVVGVAQGMYQAISAGASAGTEANTLLSAAIKAAIGGVSNVTDAVTLGTSVSNAYGKSMGDVSQVFDTAFTTVRSGVTNFSELAAYMYQVLPTASALSISFEEINAGLIAMTKQGTPASVAMTQQRAAMDAVASSNLDQYFQAVGYANGQAAIKAVGFAGAMQVIANAAGGSVGQLKAMLGSSEATSAVLAVTGDKATLFAQAMEDVANKAGAADTAYRKIADGLNNRYQSALANISTTQTQFGKQAAQVFVPIVEAIAAVLQKLSDLATEYPQTFAVIAQGITIVAGVVAALGTLVVVLTTIKAAAVLFIPALAGIVTGFGTAAISAGAFMAALAPVGIMIGALVTAYAAAQLATAGYREEAERVEQQFITTLQTAKQFRDALGELSNSEFVTDDVIQHVKEVRAAVMSGRVAKEEGIAVVNSYLQAVRQAAQEETQLQNEITAKQQRLSQLKQNLAEQEKQLAQQVKQEKIQATQETLQKAQQALQQSIQAEQNYAQQVKQLRADLEQSQTSAQDKLRALQRRGMSEAEQQADIEAQIQEKMQAGVEALKAGETKKAAAYAQSAQGLAEQLKNNELAVKFFESSQKIVESAKQKEIQAVEQAAAAQQKVTEQQRGNVEILKAQLAELQGEQTIPIVADIAQSQAAIAEVQQQLDALQDKVIKVEVQSVGGGLEFRGDVQGYQRGGGIGDKGGKLSGYGGGDRRLILAEDGEFMVNKFSTLMLGDWLEAINTNPEQVKQLLDELLTIPHFSIGGSVADSLNHPTLALPTNNTGASPNSNASMGTVTVQLILPDGQKLPSLGASYNEAQAFVNELRKAGMAT